MTIIRASSSAAGPIGTESINEVITIDVNSVDQITLSPATVYTDQYGLGLYMLDSEGQLRDMELKHPVNPKYLQGITDFRDSVDLTSLGISSNSPLSINSNSFVGEVSGVLDPIDGLKITEIQSNAWQNLITFKSLGSKVDEGKTLELIIRANGITNVMVGLFGLHQNFENMPELQNYTLLTPSVYYRTTNSGQIYRPYFGRDDRGYDSNSITFLNDEGNAATLSNMNGKWFKVSISAMGNTGGFISAVEVDTTVTDIFSTSAEVGTKLTRQIPSNRGNMSKHSCLGIAVNRFDNGLDLMSVNIS